MYINGYLSEVLIWLSSITIDLKLASYIFFCRMCFLFCEISLAYFFYWCFCFSYGYIGFMYFWFYLFFKFFIIVNLHCSVNFCYTAKWSSHTSIHTLFFILSFIMFFLDCMFCEYIFPVCSLSISFSLRFLLISFIIVKIINILVSC